MLSLRAIACRLGTFIRSWTNSVSLFYRNVRGVPLNIRQITSFQHAPYIEHHMKIRSESFWRTKFDAGLTPSLPVSDLTSEAAWVNKGINVLFQSCLCLTRRSGCSSIQRQRQRCWCLIQNSILITFYSYSDFLWTSGSFKKKFIKTHQK